MFDDPRDKNCGHITEQYYPSFFGNDQKWRYQKPIPSEFLPSGPSKSKVPYRQGPIGHWLSHYNDPWCSCHYYLPRPHQTHFFHYPTATAMDDPFWESPFNHIDSTCRAPEEVPPSDVTALLKQHQIKSKLVSTGWKISGFKINEARKEPPSLSLSSHPPPVPPNTPMDSTRFALPWIIPPSFTNKPDENKEDETSFTHPSLSLEQRWGKIQKTARQLSHVLDLSKPNGILFSTLEDDASFYTCPIPPQDHCVIEIEDQSDNHHKTSTWWHRFFSRFL